MSEKVEITHIPEPEGVVAGNGYTNVVTGTGRLVTVAGQIALDRHGNLVGEGDPEAQARQVFENLRRCLASAGVGFDEVVKLTYFVTDIAFLPAIRTVRDEYVDTARPPASSAVEVSRLFRPDLLLEIEAFALAP
ncbi:RidA family protein [Streptomyces sp. NPDC048172]|uniref:RidA family protein n=1 Tax=Streptomyces sp. NPDC048172 TaxID=3365505 RepID=UPI003724835A